MSHETIINLLMDRLPSDYPEKSLIRNELTIALKSSNNYEWVWKQVLSNVKNSEQTQELTRDQLLALYCHPDRIITIYGSDSFFRDLQIEGKEKVNEFLKNLELRLSFELIGFNLSDTDKVNVLMKPLIELEKWRWLNVLNKNDCQELKFDQVRRELLDDHTVKVVNVESDVADYVANVEKTTDEKVALLSQTEPASYVTYGTVKTPLSKVLSDSTKTVEQPPTETKDVETKDSKQVKDLESKDSTDKKDLESKDCIDIETEFEKIMEDLTNFAKEKKREPDNTPPVIENVNNTDSAEEAVAKQRKWNWINLSLPVAYVSSKWTPFIANIMIDIERYAKNNDLSANRYYTLVSDISNVMQKILPPSAGQISYNEWLQYFEEHPAYKLTYETTTHQPVVSLIPREAVNAQFNQKSDVHQSS